MGIEINGVEKNRILKYYPMNIVEHKGNTYLFGMNNSNMFQIDEPMVRLLNSEGKTVEEIYNEFKDIWSEEEVNSIVEQLEKKMILKTYENNKRIEKKYEELDFSKHNINSVVLLISQECNLRCKYCYGEAGEYSNRGRMSLDVAENAIRFLFKNSKKEELNVTFFGGEPLLEFKKIKNLVEYSKALASEYGKAVNFSITTNGTLLNDEITKFLKENQFSITLSIDGKESVNDSNRFYFNKEGAYKKTISHTEELRKSYRVTARATITSKSLSIMDNLEHLQQLSFANIHMSPSVNMLNDEEYDILIENYEKMIDRYMGYLKNKEYRKIKNMGNVHTLLERIHNGGMRFKNCGAGNNMIAVDIDGNLYPCHRLVTEKECAIGNVYDDININSYNNILNNMLLKNNKKCSSCWALNICGAGCSQENLLMTKHLNESYYNNCKFMKAIIEKAIHSYIDLSDDEKKLLFEYKENNGSCS